MLDGLPGGVAGGKGDLQIKAAGIAVHIQQLAGKVKAGDEFGFHRFWVDLRDVHPACGDDRLLNGSEGNRCDGHGFD